MANEFKHLSVGTELTQAEWEAIAGHVADGQAQGDVLYFNGTNWVRLPAGVSGQILRTFGAAANPAWTQDEQTLRTTADVTNATTTFADITGLSFTALANKDYIIEGWLIFQSDTATCGIKFALNGPASPVAVAMLAHIPIALDLYASDSCRASRAYNSCVPSVSVDTINANLLCKIEGLVRNGATEGALALRFAAETTGTVKIMTGSVLRYRQVN